MPSAANPSDSGPDIISGLYVHVPFCFHKCHYCDFYSITRQSVERMQEFVGRILAEARLWTTSSGTILQPRTVFFGGGTPSLLPIEQMSRLLRGLHDLLDLSHVSEWTVEVNPATASLEYFQMLRSFGVGRISFGAQSFNPDELKILERHHNPDDVPRSLEQARSTGFERLNIDLIYAIPGQSLASWCKSLEAAVALGLSHYSCYGLTYEPNTPIAVRRRLGLLKQAEDSIELEMLCYTRERLTRAGCPPYEISNYAANGQECQHNLLYWTGGDYAGLGPSAASHVRGRRSKNRPHLGEWEQAIDRGELPAGEVEQLSPNQRAGELIMLLLRLTRGVNFSDFADRTGFNARMIYAQVIDRLAHLGLLHADNRGFRLSESGLNVADSIAAEFLSHLPS